MKITLKDYLPIIYIYAVSFLVALNLTFYYAPVLRISIMWFLGAFALIFAVLKIVKLQGFVDSFVEYDFISKKFKYYAYAFPFFELIFGLTFILKYQNIWLELLCLIFYSVNLLSVARALLKKQKFMCACLGGFFAVPLSYVSLMENITMILGVGYLVWYR